MNTYIISQGMVWVWDGKRGWWLYLDGHHEKSGLKMYHFARKTQDYHTVDREYAEKFLGRDVLSYGIESANENILKEDESLEEL